MPHAAAEALDAQRVRQGFGHFPCGVAVRAARLDGDDHILVVSSLAVGISLHPVLVLCSVQHASSTWPKLRLAGRIGVSILSAGQQQMCRQLESRDRTLRTRGIAFQCTPGGAIAFDGVAGWMECRIYDEHPAGDHDIVVLEVLDMETRPEREPPVFQGSRFRTLG